MSRLHRRLALTGTVLALVGVAAPTTALARHGADDPVGHIRQSRGADDAVGHIRRSRGADDAVGHIRRSRGADDAVVAAGTTASTSPDDASDDRRGRGRGRGGRG